MENKYFKKEILSGSEFQIAVNKDFMLRVMCDKIETSNTPMTVEHILSLDYKEITRKEFMEAYIPLNKKINEKIAEL